MPFFAREGPSREGVRERAMTRSLGRGDGLRGFQGVRLAPWPADRAGTEAKGRDARTALGADPAGRVPGQGTEGPICRRASTRKHRKNDVNRDIWDGRSYPINGFFLGAKIVQK